MYPGTWNLYFSHYSYMYLRWWGWPGTEKNKNLGNYFQYEKKLFNFWDFVTIKVAKSKVNHLG